MKHIKEQSEQLLKLVTEKRSSGEGKIDEKIYELKTLIRQLNPSETTINAQIQDDLIIESKRKNGYKWKWV